MNAGQSIRIAVQKKSANVLSIVQEALSLEANYFGFYWDDCSEEWSFWTAETAENTATNCYYSKPELLHLLLEQYAPRAA